MPTWTQIRELINYCTWTWDATKKGYIVSGNNNSIFLPAGGFRVNLEVTVENYGDAGFYWSRTLNNGYNLTGACYLIFTSEYRDVYNDHRCCGRLIRPVRSE